MDEVERRKQALELGPRGLPLPSTLVHAVPLRRTLTDLRERGLGEGSIPMLYAGAGE